MHLLEQYALSSGLKIGKPFIYQVFFPIESERYICFHPNSKFDSKNYDYWQLVIDLIHPILKKNGIDIVQIGAAGEKGYSNCIQTQGQASINQSSYIIRNSILSLGADSFSAHVASGFGKKIVSIYSNNNINNCKPYWSDKEDVILLEPERFGEKPNYSAKESPKTINRIKPEIIANHVLKLLNIDETVKIETLFIGENFNGETNFGFLPNQIVVSEKIPELRMDLFPEEKHLSAQLSRQRTIITTNRPISQETLLKFKANVAKVIYLIDENDKPEFVKFLFENGFAFDCVSKLPPDRISSKKINYYRYCAINEHLESEQEKQFKTKLKSILKGDNLKFRTNYIICSDRKNYLSEQHLLDNEQVDDVNGFYNLKDTDLFLSDLKNAWVIKELY